MENNEREYWNHLFLLKRNRSDFFDLSIKMRELKKHGIIKLEAKKNPDERPNSIKFETFNNKHKLKFKWDILMNENILLDLSVNYLSGFNNAYTLPLLLEAEMLNLSINGYTVFSYLNSNPIMSLLWNCNYISFCKGVAGYEANLNDYKIVTIYDVIDNENFSYHMIGLDFISSIKKHILGIWDMYNMDSKLLFEEELKYKKF